MADPTKLDMATEKAREDYGRSKGPTEEFGTLGKLKQPRKASAHVDERPGQPARGRARPRAGTAAEEAALHYQGGRTSLRDRTRPGYRSENVEYRAAVVPDHEPGTLSTDYKIQGVAMSEINSLPRHSVDYMWGGLDANFRAALEAFFTAAGGQLSLTSGYRSNDHQADLVARAKAQHGDNWRKWAAPPGGSNHNRGIAADIAFTNDAAKQWAHQNAPRFGLHFPMGHEPWHIEPLGSTDGKTYEPWPDAYTPGFGNSLNPVNQPPEIGITLDQMLRGSQPTIEEAGMTVAPPSTITDPGASLENDPEMDPIIDEGPDLGGEM